MYTCMTVCSIVAWSIVVCCVYRVALLVSRYLSTTESLVLCGVRRVKDPHIGCF